MKTNLFPSLIISTLIISLFLWGCEKDFKNVELPEWSPTIAIPLLSTSLSMDDIIEESENIQFDDDYLIRFVYTEDTIISVVVSDLVDLPAQEPFLESYKLGVITISDFGIFDSISLGSLLESVDPELQSLIEENNGETIYFPPFSNVEPYLLELPMIEELVSAHFSSGSLNLEVTNKYPISLTDVVMELRNINDNSIVAALEIENIDPLETQLHVINLSEKDITNELELELISFSSPGSGPDPYDPTSWVTINLDDALVMDFYSADLEVSSGIAHIEEQIFNLEIENIDLSLEDYSLSRIDFKNTAIDYSFTSGIQADISVKISMLNAHYLSSGEMVTIDILIPYSSGGNPVTGQVDLSGASFDLSSSNNTIPIEYELGIYPIGGNIEFDSSNQVQLEMNFGEIDFSLIQGYFGKTTFEFDQGEFDLNFDFLNYFEGDLTIADAEISLNYMNSLGLPIAAKFEMIAYDEEDNAQGLNYQSSPGNDSMYFDFPEITGETVNNQILISESTSDIGEFLGLPPSRIEYSGMVATNTFGNSVENFVTDESEILLGFEINTPFSIIANNVAFQDTMNLNVGDSLELNINYANIKMNVHNGFPFEMNLQLILIDSVSMNHLDTITFDQSIASAEVDDQGKVEAPVSSLISIIIDEQTFENLKESNKSIIKARISGANGGDQAIKFYSNYELAINLAILAEFKINEL